MLSHEAISSNFNLFFGFEANKIVTFVITTEKGQLRSVKNTFSINFKEVVPKKTCLLSFEFCRKVKKLFICSIRKLPRIEVFIFVLFSLAFFDNDAHDLDVYGQFFYHGTVFEEEFLGNIHDEDIISCFVSLFFFFDDRFISKYLLSRTDTESRDVCLRKIIYCILLFSGFFGACNFYRKYIHSTVANWHHHYAFWTFWKIGRVFKSHLYELSHHRQLTQGFGRQNLPLTSTTKIFYVFWFWRCRCEWMRRNNNLNMRSLPERLQHLEIINNNAVWLIGKYFYKARCCVWWQRTIRSL